MGSCMSCCQQQNDMKQDLLKDQSSRYTPPAMNGANQRRDIRTESVEESDPSRVSLPLAPSQIVRTKSYHKDKVHEAWAHVEKDGYLVKQGHKFRNWKRRYFILHNGMLRYYEAPGPRVNGEPTGQKEKGFVPLAGATVTKKVSELGRCKLTLLTVGGLKNQVLEAENPLELDAWFDAISQEILAANVDSLRKGERVEEVTQWYGIQHQRNCDAMGLIRFGLLALLHIVDTSGFDHLVSCWIQSNKDDTGFVINIAKDKQGMNDTVSRGSGDVVSMLTPIQKELDGTEVLFKHIQFAQMGPIKDVHPSARLGPQACIFAILTKADAFDIEIDSPSRAEEWVRAINNATKFSWIPVPGVRRVVPNL